jgi:3-oxoacyl-[acyl-carrier protein] reductase
MPSTPVPYDLNGKAALVTGAGVGLGQAIAIELARCGAIVGIHYHSSRAGAEETLKTIESAKGRGVILQADLTKEDHANKLVDDFVKQAGNRLDIVVNNAGALVGRATIEETSLDLWRGSLDTNLTSAFLVTRRAIPLLRKSGSGRIVNVLSLSTQTGGANGAGAYAAAKGGLLVFTRTLAKELAPQVRTNSVVPGVIETRHHEMASSPERMAEYRKQTPLGRNGQAEEVASAVVYLCSDASSFINGAMLDINGGRFIR